MQPVLPKNFEGTAFAGFDHIFNDDLTKRTPQDVFLERTVNQLFYLTDKNKSQFDAMPVSKDPVFVKLLRAVANEEMTEGNERRIKVVDPTFGELSVSETYKAGGIPVLKTKWEPSAPLKPWMEASVNNALISTYKYEDLSAHRGATMLLQREVKEVVREGKSLSDFQNQLKALL